MVRAGFLFILSISLSASVLMARPGLVAEAGPRQLVQDQDRDGLVQVKLNAGDSVSVGGKIMRYTWEAHDEVLYQGPMSEVTLSLPHGQYPITLTVEDNHGRTATDSTVIALTHLPNRRPIVDVKQSQTVLLPQPGFLDAWITDDGLPKDENLNASWSFVSGPGSVEFEYSDRPKTKVYFSLPGEYVLQLRASDGELFSSLRTRVTVQPMALTEDLYAINDAPQIFPRPTSDEQAILP